MATINQPSCKYHEKPNKPITAGNESDVVDIKLLKYYMVNLTALCNDIKQETQFIKNKLSQYDMDLELPDEEQEPMENADDKIKPKPAKRRVKKINI